MFIPAPTPPISFLSSSLVIMSIMLLLFRGNNVTQRIKRALDDLAREIGKELRRKKQQKFGIRNPVPVPVAVPVRNGSWNVCKQFKRSFSSCPYNFSGRAHCRPFKFRFMNMRFKLFKHYQTRSMRLMTRWGGMRGHFVQNNLQNQLRARFLEQRPARNLGMGVRLMYGLRDECNDDNKDIRSFHPTKVGVRKASSSTAVPLEVARTIPSLLRLNLSLTPQHHEAALRLANEVPEPEIETVGCYVDFPLNAHLTIPSATFLTDEVLLEVMDNLHNFERQVAELKQDLTKLFDLGELPIKYLVNKNVIRVYFANCDRIQLESLLRDKNIQGGIIHEDMSCRIAVDDSPPVTDTDILSSFGSSSMSMSSAASSDIFSEELAEPLNCDNVVRPTVMEPSNEVRISDYESDEYYWVSA